MKKLLPKALIFDLDGTLLDTIGDLADCCNYALASEGLLPLEKEEYKYHVGSGAKNLVESAYASALSKKLTRHVDRHELAADKVAELYKLFNEAYADGWDKKTLPYPGIEKLLTQLRVRGMSLAVLSNKPDGFTKKIADHFFADKTFDIVFGKRQEWPLKPDPASTLHICKILGAKPEETAFIGDSGSDMETAVRAGLQAWAVLWGFRGIDELNHSGAQEVFANVTELEQHLLHNQ